jgi:hypothetical protein
MTSLQSKLILSALGVALLATPALAAPTKFHGPSAANTVIENGTVVGADPDARIRGALMRDWDFRYGE